MSAIDPYPLVPGHPEEGPALMVYCLNCHAPIPLGPPGYLCPHCNAKDPSGLLSQEDAG